jgi:hypothetical protein
MGYDLSRSDLDKAYKLFTKLADQKKEIFEEDLLAILQDGFAQIPSGSSSAPFRRPPAHQRWRQHWSVCRTSPAMRSRPKPLPVMDL